MGTFVTTLDFVPITRLENLDQHCSHRGSVILLGLTKNAPLPLSKNESWEGEGPRENTYKVVDRCSVIRQCNILEVLVWFQLAPLPSS